MPENSVIEIIVHDNDPEGLKTIRVIGKVLSAIQIPRSEMSKVKDFENINNPAVYFLINETEDESNLYIGKTDNLLRRLCQQRDDKEDWNIALAFLAERDLNVDYLEKECLELARDAGRYKLSNSTSSPGSGATKSTQIVNSNYLKDIIFITKILGLKIFSSKQNLGHTSDRYFINSKGIRAEGSLLESNEFLVYKGSSASTAVAPNFEKHLKSSDNLRRRLIEDGVLRKSEAKDAYEFIEDHIFSSPSSAADVVRGTSSNGWTVWKDDEGNTLDTNIRSKK